MAKQAVQESGVSIKLACEAFRVSETCYRYQPKRRAENDVIADWLIRLTENRRNWGFGVNGNPNLIQASPASAIEF
ncbi:MAG: hypothetical protein RL678_351 [Pseudomonadota bacterium]|jgi:putative transposase